MQIRTRKTGVSLIRSVYDPAIKRCRAVVVGTMPVGTAQPPADIYEQLTASERYTVDAFCARNAARQEVQRQQAAGTGLADTLRLATAWYRRQPRSPALAQQAAECRQVWSELLAAMCAAGVGRTRKRRKAS